MSANTMPEGLALIVDFLNTKDVEDGADEVGDPRRLRDWFAQRDLVAPDEELSDADVVRAQKIREAVRALLWAKSHGRKDEDALELLNRDAAHASWKVSFDPGGECDLGCDERGLDGALGDIFGAMFKAMANGTWVRLKVCRKDTCRYAFYDRSKNRSRSWCDMAICGNRVKAQTFRERHTAET